MLISLKPVDVFSNQNVRPEHNCVIRGVNSGQPLWFSMVQVADALLVPETIISRLAIFRMFSGCAQSHNSSKTENRENELVAD